MTWAVDSIRRIFGSRSRPSASGSFMSSRMIWGRQSATSREALLSGRGGADLVAAILEHPGQGPGDRGLVVNDQDFALHERIASAGTGNESRNVTPPCERLRTVIRPPCSRTSWQRDREAQAGSGRLGREERVEDPVEVFLRDPASRVADGDLDGESASGSGGSR